MFLPGSYPAADVFHNVPIRSDLTTQVLKLINFRRSLSINESLYFHFFLCSICVHFVSLTLMSESLFTILTFISVCQYTRMLQLLLCWCWCVQMRLQFVLYIQMELCSETLKHWLEQRNGAVNHTAGMSCSLQISNQNTVYSLTLSLFVSPGLTLGYLTNPSHCMFPHLADWCHGLCDHLTVYSALSTVFIFTNELMFYLSLSVCLSVYPSVCLSLCMSVCLLAALRKNYWTYLHEKFTADVSMDEEERITF